MELYVLVSFWMLFINIVLRGLVIVSTKYPREATITLGLDMISFVTSIVFIMWCFSLLWIV